MEYTISNSRIRTFKETLQNRQLSEPEMAGLLELLKLDTQQATPQFLRSFRDLKQHYPLLKLLTQPKSGFCGVKSLAYWFKGSTVRAKRYQELIYELKSGKSSGNASYFQNITQPQSFCSKINSAANEYYQIATPSALQQSKFHELISFNQNLGYAPAKMMPDAAMARCANDDPQIWNYFLEYYPQYKLLTFENQNDATVVNIHGVNCQQLQQELRQQLKLAENEVIFVPEGLPSSSVNLGIKQYINILAATKIGSLFRGVLARRPEDAEGVVPAIRDSNQQIIGYKIQQHSVALPALKLKRTPVPNKAVPLKQNVANGLPAFDRSMPAKVLTHANSEYVGINLQRPLDNFDYAFSQKISLLLIKYKFKHIVPQIRINRDFFIAKNLGACDLQQLINRKVYRESKFKISHFLPLLGEVEFLHRNGVVLRDIKPGNIFFKDDEMYLTDLDSMVEIGNEGVAFSSPYISEPLMYSSQHNSSKIDQLCLLNSMIVAYSGEDPIHGLHERTTIAKFIKAFVKREYWHQVYNFLVIPRQSVVPELSTLFNAV